MVLESHSEGEFSTGFEDEFITPINNQLFRVISDKV